MTVSNRTGKTMLFLSGLLLLCGSSASGVPLGTKAEIYGAWMGPNNDDAENYADDGWGGGFRFVLPIEAVSKIFAFDCGLDFINLMDETTRYREAVTGLRIEQQTSQWYGRFYIGGEIGGHGRGFLKPYAGVHLALVSYGISTTLIIPDDFDPDRSIRQDQGGATNVRMGYDITLGTDINFANRWHLTGGVRYLKSFGVPQQLGPDSITIHPDYFEVFAGVGFDIAWAARNSK
jgi:opacity protein-like surface antigen